MFNMKETLEKDRKKALASGKLQGTKKKPNKLLQLLNGKNSADWRKK